MTVDGQEVYEIIQENLDPNSGLICAFWNWETTYYIPFSKGLAENNFEIIQKEDSREMTIDKISDVLESYGEEVILDNKSILLKEVLNEQQNTFQIENRTVTLKLDAICENEIIVCYAYQVNGN